MRFAAFACMLTALVASCSPTPPAPEFPLLRVKQPAQFYNAEGTRGVLSRSGDCLVVEGISLVWPFDAEAQIAGNGEINVSSAFFQTSVRVGQRVLIGGSVADAAEVAGAPTAWENFRRSGCLPPYYMVGRFDEIPAAN